MTKKQEISTLFKSFNRLTALIVGDVMIDSYFFGNVDRISPEAPVPVVSVKRKENRLGGAANVALNIQALGAKPILCSVIGNDNESIIFDELLKSNRLSNKGILKSKNRQTTIKTRVIGNNHQMIRVDEETDKNLTENDQKALIKKIKSILDSEKVDVVIFEDYDKGNLSEFVISKVVEICNNKKIPTTVDPKKRNFLHYKKVTLFKPNLKELKEGLNIDINPKNNLEIEKAIKILNNKLNNTNTFITLSENGVYITDHTSSYHEPAHVRNISDVSGAGDTVISVASLCVALNLPIKTIASLANLAGGLVCEKVGVVPINKEELLSEIYVKLS